MADDSSIVLLDHVSDEKFERRGNMRVVACRFYELLPDHRVRFCAACLPHDTVDGLKQWGVTIECTAVSEGRTVSEANARADKLGEVLSHDVLRSDLL